MNERDKSLILDFKRGISHEISQHIRRLIVFGSRVEGKAKEDSDLDLLALVDEKTPEIEKELEDIAYQVMWDYDFKPIISLKVFEESCFYNALKKGFSFYQYVEKEGVPI
ncbi:MAG: nucleotidyltransferase domain-containing protein [bacterium]